jgi:hypothetical protein
MTMVEITAMTMTMTVTTINTSNNLSGGRLNPAPIST